MHLEYMKEVQKASKLYGDKVYFMFVNCKKNYQFCITRNTQYMLIDSELMFPYEEDVKSENNDIDISDAPFLQKMMKEKGITEEQVKVQLMNRKVKKKEFQVVTMGTKDRSVAGIETLFIEYGILDSRFDPDLIIKKNLEHKGLLDIV